MADIISVSGLGAALIVIAYLCGSISAAILVCRALKLPDPRTLGSHNPGATNVLRIGGKKAAALTLLGDTLKGMLPVAIALLLPLSQYEVGWVGGGGRGGRAGAAKPTGHDLPLGSGSGRKRRRHNTGGCARMALAYRANR
ncbi:MAG: glycerol-3-phosphate acyltransferase [Gammaproteobacteria bacterium]